MAKESTEILLNTWLKGKSINAPAEPKTKYNIEKISWEDRIGPKGPFQISKDVDNPDFQALTRDLEEHSGKLAKKNFFFWKFGQSNAIGRKRSSF